MVNKFRGVDELADELLPVDGPHTAERVTAAAELLGELVRRLNHATQRDRSERTLPYPATVDRMVGSLHRAAALLPQTLEQMAHRLGQLGDMPGLYDDRRDHAPGPPDYTATYAGVLLRDEVAPRVRAIADELAAVCNHTSHLGVETGGGEH